MSRILSLFLLLGNLFSQNTASFKLTGKIAFWEHNDSCEITLFHIPEGEKKEKFFTDKNGEFSLQGSYLYYDKSKTGEYSLLIINPERTQRIGVRIWLEPEKELSVLVSRDTLIYEGSELQESFSRFIAPFWKYYVRTEEYKMKYLAVPSKFLKKRRKFEMEFSQNYFRENPDKIFVYAFLDVYRAFYPVDFWEEVCLQGSQYFRDNRYVQGACDRASGKNLREGVLAPVFSLKDTSGSSVSLEDFRGKYVLLYFWASWCAPCVKSIPFMNELYEEYSSKPFEIVFISLDFREVSWKQALKKYQPSGVQLLATREVLNKYGIRGIPVVFLITPEGKFDRMRFGSKAKLARYLKKTLSKK